MNKEEIKVLLEGVKDNKINVEEALEKLEDLLFKDLGFAKIDNHREIRFGYPEVDRKLHNSYCGKYRRFVNLTMS